MAEGHMKTMLYGESRACVHIILETSPRLLCNLQEIRTLSFQTHSFGYKGTKIR